MEPTARRDAEAAYRENGFAVFRGVIDADLVREAAQHVEWLTRRYPHLRPEHLHHPLMRDDAFWMRLVTDERILDVVELFLGPDIACFTAHYICKPPRDGMAVLWHQDGAYWKLRPMTALSVWLAVDESTPENGCLRMLPGTHRRPLAPLRLRDDQPNMLCSSIDEPSIDTSGAVDVVLRPGDVSVHHPHVVHGSEPNRSDRRRCGLDIGYIPTSVAISNRGLYLNPVLVRGRPVAGVNRYRAWPRWSEATSMPFRGREAWDRRAEAVNAEHGFADEAGEDPLLTTARMIERLQAGTLSA